MLCGFDEFPVPNPPKKGVEGPCCIQHVHLGGGFKQCLYSLVLGEMIQFDEHMFSMG